MYISQKGREYRQRVIDEVGKIEPMKGRLAVRMRAYVPDRRRRDLDNIFKALFDSLEHAGVFEDDEQITLIMAQKCEKVPGGKVDIEIEEIL